MVVADGRLPFQPGVVNQFDPTVGMLDECRAVFHPVTAVVVVDPVDLPDGRHMDVAADDSAAVFLFRVAGHEMLKVINEVHCPFHLCLQE